MREHRADELENFKTRINLAEYAATLGYEIDKRESSRSSVVMRGPGDDKIIVATDSDGHGVYFSVRDEADNGSIIDFAQRRLGLNLGQTRKELRPFIGERADPPPIKITKPKPGDTNRPRVQGWWMRMHPQPEEGHPYLRQRGLSAETLSDPRFSPMIRQDHRGNAVFPHYDRDGLSGYELKNDGFTGFSKGGEKRIWYSTNIMHATRIVVTESAIDAMSHAQATGDAEAAYLSIGGQPSEEQWELVEVALRKAQERGAAIEVGTDNDEAGERLASRIAGIAPGATRCRPEEAGDWNEQLQSDQQRERRRPGFGFMEPR